MNNQEAFLAFDRALTKQYEFDLDLAAGRAHSILCSTETETQPVNANFVNTLEKLLTTSMQKVSPIKQLQFLNAYFICLKTLLDPTHLKLQQFYMP